MIYRCADCGEEFELDETAAVIHTEEDFGGCGPLIRLPVREENADQLCRPSLDAR